MSQHVGGVGSGAQHGVVVAAEEGLDELVAHGPLLLLLLVVHPTEEPSVEDHHVLHHSIVGVADGGDLELLRVLRTHEHVDVVPLLDVVRAEGRRVAVELLLERCDVVLVDITVPPVLAADTTGGEHPDGDQD